MKVKKVQQLLALALASITTLMSTTSTRIKRVAAIGLALLAGVGLAGAATVAKDFSADPATHGWQTFGEASLFQWDSTNHNLMVTWDSSKPNSYYYHPLGTIRTRDDDFGLAFDLKLSDAYAGGYGFQLAISLLNFADATSTNLQRGVGIVPVYGPRNLAEFAYFPSATEFFNIDPTVSPTLLSSNNEFAAGFDYPLELTNGDWFHVDMAFTASNQTLVTFLKHNGEDFGIVTNVVVPTADKGFSDFHLDTVAISSYNDINSYGSVLAHGVVANLVVTLPPPVNNLTGGFAGSNWQARFGNHNSWFYDLERSDAFHDWAPVVTNIPGNGAELILQDTNPPPDKAFYRINAYRP